MVVLLSLLMSTASSRCWTPAGGVVLSFRQRKGDRERRRSTAHTAFSVQRLWGTLEHDSAWSLLRGFCCCRGRWQECRRFCSEPDSLDISWLRLSHLVAATTVRSCEEPGRLVPPSWPHRVKCTDWPRSRHWTAGLHSMDLLHLYLGILPSQDLRALCILEAYSSLNTTPAHCGCCWLTSFQVPWPQTSSSRRSVWSDLLGVHWQYPSHLHRDSCIGDTPLSQTHVTVWALVSVVVMPCCWRRRLQFQFCSRARRRHGPRVTSLRIPQIVHEWRVLVLLYN